MATPHLQRPGASERLGVIAGSALFLYLILFRDGTLIYLFRPSEGGIWIDEAERVLQGQVLYRDFFEFLTPGIVYLNAAVMAALGRNVVALGAAAVALGAALAGVVHAASARVLGPRWRLLPPIAVVVLLYATHGLGDHKWPALLAGFLALGLLLRPAPSVLAFGGAGALLGLSALFTLDFGAGLAAGVLVWSLLEQPRVRRRDVCALVAGGLAAFALPMAYFAARAGLGTVIDDCLVFPLTAYRGKNVFGVDLLRHVGPRSLAQVTLAAGGLLAALTLVMSKARGDPARLVAFAGLGLLAATAHRPLGALSLAVRSSVLSIALAALLERLSRRPENRRGFLAARLVLAALVLGVVWGVGATVVRRQFLEPLVRERHRAGEIWTPWPFPDVAWVETQTREGEAALILPAGGGLYFLSRTRNPTSLPHVVPGMTREADVAKALSEIEAAPPSVAVWNITDVSPELYRALLRTYAPAGTAANGSILMRRRPSPAPP